MTARHSVEHSDRGTKSGQVSQEFTVVTSAPQRALAAAALGLAFAGSAAMLGGLGGTAWADTTPTPVAGTAAAEPVAPSDAPEAPATQPSVGSWIIGGTLQEGTAGAPAAKPAAKPAAVQPARATTATTKTTKTTGTATRSTRTSTRRATSSTTSGSAATAPDGATALPFTGGPVDVLLPSGMVLLGGGLVLTAAAARPRRVVA